MHKSILVFFTPHSVQQQQQLLLLLLLLSSGCYLYNEQLWKWWQSCYIELIISDMSWSSSAVVTISLSYFDNVLTLDSSRQQHYFHILCHTGSNQCWHVCMLHNTGGDTSLTQHQTTNITGNQTEKCSKQHKQKYHICSRQCHLCRKQHINVANNTSRNVMSVADNVICHKQHINAANNTSRNVISVANNVISDAKKTQMQQTTQAEMSCL